MIVTLSQVWTVVGVYLLLDAVTGQTTTATVSAMLMVALALTVAAWMNRRF